MCLDGAVFSNSNILGVGVVARNSNGQLIASLPQLFNQAYKAIEIEAMEATWASEFAVELGLDIVVVKGDSSIVMTTLKTKKPSLVSYGFLISDVYVFESFFFFFSSELSYSYTKREGNKVAHHLAKLAINFPDSVIWIEDVPPLVFSFV